MARLQLIVPLLLWVIWLSNATATRDWQITSPGLGTAIYTISLGLIVMRVRASARRAMRRHAAESSTAVVRLHQVIFAARWSILLLHAMALFFLGFGDFLLRAMPAWMMSTESLAAVLSIAPVAAAWMGLVWAEHPLERAVREQNAVYAFEFGEPVYPIPTLRQQILGAFRLQILFTLVPVLLIGLTRDVSQNIFHRLGGHNDTADLTITLAAMAGTFALSPELLRRVLPTQPLPTSELRDRLEALCTRLKLRYRNILIWKTHHTLDNAAVMGLVPQVRYILLSDLLIATMTQDQIEAVFAHEAGHVKHWHMAWYLLFFLTLTLSLGCITDVAVDWRPLATRLAPGDIETIVTVAGILVFFVLFGMLSRSMERQADVFAALSMTAPGQPTPVGRDGVAVFCSALAKVARVNNMPLDGNALAFGKRGLRRWYARLVHHSANWLHGSIRSRLDYLQSLIDSPDRLNGFNRRMIIIRAALLAGLAGSLAWTILSSLPSK